MATIEVYIPEFEEMIAKKQMVYRRWTDEEKAILQKYYGKIPICTLAEKIGRSYDAVTKKALIMGLT